MKPGMLEKIFAVFTLLLFTGPLIPLTLRNGGLSVDTSNLSELGNPLTQALFLAVYAGAILLLGRRRCLEWAKKDRLILLLLGLAVLSVSWSEDPATTFKRALALLGTAAASIYLASQWKPKDLIKLLAWSLGLAALASVAVALIAPAYGVMSDISPGAWQGIYTHKNIFGRVMALGAISFMFLAFTSPKYRRIGWGGFLLLLVLVIESRSLTALLALLATLSLIPVLLALRRRPAFIPSLTMALFALAMLTVWLTGSSHDVVNAFGRDPTFTGRVDLWQSASTVISKRPWLGHGYGTGWVGGGDDATTDIAQFTEWNAPNAHNGFLNLTLDLGFVGLILFLAASAVAFHRAIRHLRVDPSMEALWPPILLTFVLLTNLMESLLLKYNSIDWLLYVATLLSIASITRVPAPDNP